MSLEHFKSLVDQIAPYAYSLILFHLGEPLLHPQLADMIAYAHHKKIFVIINSHLNRLDTQLAHELIASGLGQLNVSVDGSTQEIYAKYRVGGNLTTVLNNIARLTAEKKRQQSYYPLINLRFLITRQNEHQLDDVRRTAGELGVGFSTGQFFFDYTDPVQVNKWLPSEKNRSAFLMPDEYDSPDRCADLWEHMTVYQDGSLVPCCWFNHPNHVVGNAWRSSLQEIWRSESYVHARTLFKKGGDPKRPIPTCADCRGKPLSTTLFVKNLHPVKSQREVPR